LVQKSRAKTAPLTPAQRLLVLDTWRRSGRPTGDFAALVGLSKHTLYAWKKKFDQQGPAGLMDQPRGAPAGSRLPDLTRRTILLLKESNPPGAASASATCCCVVPPCRPVPWPGCCMRPATSWKRYPPAAPG
jgi:Helix-turn-helix domain